MSDNGAIFLEPLLTLVQQVGKAILEIYERPNDIALKVKDDGSPLTEADILAHQMIVKKLRELSPNLPILSEEACDIPFSERCKWQKYWLIDPIDGTKEFLDRNGDFTINIALIENHRTVLGIVYAPVKGDCYYALQGMGAFKLDSYNVRQKLYTTPWQEGQSLRLIASRRHGQEKYAKLLAVFPHFQIAHCGSSLKFCLVAEGLADLYPRLGLTSEWDTAAAQCVLEEAGGKVLDLQGLPLLYNTRDSLQNPYFIAVGDAAVNWQAFF